MSCLSVIFHKTKGNRHNQSRRTWELRSGGQIHTILLHRLNLWMPRLLQFSKGNHRFHARQVPLILVCNVMDHIDMNTLFSNFQHGFRHNWSCRSQLFGAVHYIPSVLDNRLVDLAVFDFSKAFDKVPTECLAAKLDYYGICGLTKEWVCCFWTGHHQQVFIDGSISSDEHVLSGVPQSSAGGSGRFLIYITAIDDKISTEESDSL